MGSLQFLCPVTFNKVSTGIDIDPQSFGNLQAGEIEIDCPFCAATHVLASVCAWLEGTEREQPSCRRRMH